MKTEKFEDKIRKKLESIEPQFQEQDWEKFQQWASPTVVKAPNWYDASIFKIAASIALVGTLFLGVSQYFSNKNLAEKLAIVTQKNEELTLKQSQLEQTIAVAERLKTNANITQSENKNYGENITSTNEITRKEIGSETDKTKILSNNNRSENKAELAQIQEKENTKNSIYHKGNQSKEDEQVTFENNNKIYNETSQLAKNNRTIKPNKRKRNRINADNSSTPGGNEFEITNFTPKNANHENEVTQTGNNQIINYLPSRNFVFDSTIKFKKAFRRADFAYYKPQKAEKKKLYFTLADAHLRTGVSASLGRGLASYGINTELFLDQRISLKVGASKLQLEGKQFFTELQFKDETKRDFRDKYPVKVPSTKAILNIQEEFALMVVPTSINYYQPLQNDLFLIGSIGTDLDISGTKTIKFNYSKAPFFAQKPIQNGQPIGGPGISDDLDLERLSQKTEKKFFNNMSLAIGAEKRLGKLAVQAKVADQFLVKNVDYRKKNSITGELGLAYRF